MEEQKSSSTSIVPAFIGKDEMNLAEYPFSLLTHRIPPNRKTYSLTQHIIDSQGKTVKQTWSVLGSDKYGLPTPYDDDVILALLYCYKDQNFQGRKIHSSRSSAITGSPSSSGNHATSIVTCRPSSRRCSAVALRRRVIRRICARIV